MNPLCTPRDWQAMALAESLSALEKGDFPEAKAYLAESKRYGACADQIAALHEEILVLRTALADMRTEYRGYDLPYGSKAYALANELLIAARKPSC